MTLIWDRKEWLQMKLFLEFSHSNSTEFDPTEICNGQFIWQYDPIYLNHLMHRGWIG